MDQNNHNEFQDFPTVEEIREEVSYRSKLKDPFKNDESEDKDDIVSDIANGNPTMVVQTVENYAKFREAVRNKAEEEKKDVRDILTDIAYSIPEKDRYIYLTAIESISKSNGYKMGDIIKEEDPVNDIEYGGKSQLYSKHSPSVTKGKVSPDQAFTRFQTILGLGVGICVNLYHSGFSIMLKPATQAELLKLQFAIFSEDQELGYSTSGYFMSYKRVKTYEILKDFIFSKISAWTLDIEKESIFKYISILDFDAIVLGILKGAYDHINVSRICNNALDPNIENSRCTHAVKASLDPSKLYHVSRTILSNEMLNTLAKRGSKTVSIPEQNNYVVRLEERLIDKRKLENTYTNEIDSTKKYTIKFKIPTVEDFIDRGREWLARVERELDSLLETESDVSKEEARTTVSLITALSSVSGSVEYVEYENQELGVKEKITDATAIMNILEGLTNDLVNIQIGIINYTEKSIIGYVATPSYTCPSCGVKHEDTRDTIKKENLIGLNLVDFFFMVVGFQKQISSVERFLD